MKTFRKVARVVATASVVLLLAAPARAGLTFYSSLATYNASTLGNTTIGFEGIASDNSFAFQATPPGITLSGINFTINHANNNGNLFVIGQGNYYAGTSVLSSQESTTGPNNLQITLPGAYTSFALNLGSFSSSQFTFSLSTGDTFTEPTPAFPGLGFIGVTSTVAFTSLSISEPIGDVLNIDNFTFGTAAAVSEPASLTLTVAGLVLLGFVGRKKR